MVLSVIILGDGDETDGDSEYGDHHYSHLGVQKGLNSSYGTTVDSMEVNCHESGTSLSPQSLASYLPSLSLACSSCSNVIFSEVSS